MSSIPAFGKLVGTGFNFHGVLVVAMWDSFKHEDSVKRYDSKIRAILRKGDVRLNVSGIQRLRL